MQEAEEGEGVLFLISDSSYLQGLEWPKIAIRTLVFHLALRCRIRDVNLRSLFVAHRSWPLRG